MRRLNRYLIFVISLLVILMPLMVIIVLSAGTNWHYPDLWPQTFNMKYVFKMLFSNHELLSSLSSSITLAIGTVILTLVIAYPTAIALSYYDFKGKSFLNVLIYLPLIIPSIAVLTNMDFVMIKFGLEGSYFGVVAVHTLFALPYAIKLLVDNLSVLKNKYELASLNLGASSRQTFIHVTLPLSRLGLQGAVMMSYIISMTQYLGTLLIGNGNFLTLSVRMFPFTQSGKYQIAAIYAIMFMLVTLIPLYIIDVLITPRRKEVRAE
ncbi:ABC transporter permease [Companilactobacillus mishanensis]|uniref:ABC transporter permease n=1 Tax=Companilactobacillus mishanensis TaxID=2486008 RepID=UPI00129822D2|nr:ABC transporter permease subunit [Companilactobacillus mishanensis]MQS88875.1 ABC transporter permease subunit [Companilactobacillus mishanensis]